LKFENVRICKASVVKRVVLLFGSSSGGNISKPLVRLRTHKFNVGHVQLDAHDRVWQSALDAQPRMLRAYLGTHHLETLRVATHVLTT